MPVDLELPWLSSPRILPICAAASLTAVVVARAILPISWVCLPILLLAWAVAAGFALLEPRPARIASLNLFGIAAAVNGLALLVLTVVAARSGGPFLGPDSSLFLQGATTLAERGFDVGGSAPRFFETYNASQFYLFGAAIRFLHADLYALQALNVGLIALSAQVTFAVARQLTTRFARAAALAVALHPSIIGLCALDLLKEPSIIAATMLATWAVIDITRSTRVRRTVMIAAIAVLPLIYLRTGRFFVFTYLEIAAAIAAVWLLARHRRMPSGRSVTLGVILAAVFVTAELLPVAAGWPISPRIFALEARLTANSSLEPASAPRESEANPAGLHTILKRGAASSGTLGPLPQHVLTVCLNIGRRFLGPFPWVPPKHSDFRYLQANGVLMYPGVVGWYLLIPLLAVGWLHATRALWRDRRLSFGLVWLWIFAVIYLAPYAVLDFTYLPYRQRDAALPVLITVALAGIAGTTSDLHLRRWYAVFGTALLTVIVCHVAVHAWLGW